MATVTYFVDKAAVPSPLQATGAMKFRIDFKLRPCAAADVVQIVNIPAYTYVKRIITRIVTAEGATCTAEMGDGGDIDGYIDGAVAALDLNAAAGTVLVNNGTHSEATAASLTVFNGGLARPYTSADTIDLTLGHATSTAVLDVVVFFDHIAGWSE